MSRELVNAEIEKRELPPAFKRQSVIHKVLYMSSAPKEDMTAVDGNLRICPRALRDATPHVCSDQPCYTCANLQHH